MPQSILRFKIRQDGIVEESVEGVVGDSCQKLTENLEDALGNVQIRRPTSEAYQAKQVQSQSNQANIH